MGEPFEFWHQVGEAPVLRELWHRAALADSGGPCGLGLSAVSLPQQSHDSLLGRGGPLNSSGAAVNTLNGETKRVAKMPLVFYSVYVLGAAWQVDGTKNKTQTNDWEVLNAFQQVESGLLLWCINTVERGGGAGVCSHRCLGYNRISHVT